jgi:hypothetical protein
MKHIQRFYDTCNSRISNLKILVKFWLDSIEIRLTSSDHFENENDFYSHDSLCKREEIIVLNDALLQLVRRTWMNNISLEKDEIIQEVFRKKPHDSNSYSLYAAKNICNQSWATIAIMWYMEKRKFTFTKAEDL